jgi:hypothetical protein
MTFCYASSWSGSGMPRLLPFASLAATPDVSLMWGDVLCCLCGLPSPTAGATCSNRGPASRRSSASASPAAGEMASCWGLLARPGAPDLRGDGGDGDADGTCKGRRHRSPREREGREERGGRWSAAGKKRRSGRLGEEEDAGIGRVGKRRLGFSQALFISPRSQNIDCWDAK